jgi:hypothetical protein
MRPYGHIVILDAHHRCFNVRVACFRDRYQKQSLFYNNRGKVGTVAEITQHPLMYHLFYTVAGNCAHFLDDDCPTGLEKHNAESMRGKRIR